MTSTILIVILAVVYGMIGWLAAANTTRWLANYIPRRVCLEDEYDINADTNSESRPAVKSWYGIWKRTLRLEGWSGLFKGIVPAVLGVIIDRTFLRLVSHLIPLSAASNTVQRSLIRGFVVPILRTLLEMPLLILYTRATTTPLKLPWCNPAIALRLLLSKSESQKPWIILLTPGLLVATLTRQLVRLTYSSACFWIFKPYYINATPADFFVDLFTSLQVPVGVILWFLVNLVFTATFAPLVIIETRLFVQKNHQRQGASADDEEMIDSSRVVYASAEEDVIRLRDDDRGLYLGFIDCITRIINEEGWGTLYRCWMPLAFASLSGNLLWIQSLQVQ